MKKAKKWGLFCLPIVLLMILISFIGDQNVGAHSYSFESVHFRGESFGHFNGYRNGMMVTVVPAMGLFWLRVVLFKITLITVGGLMLGMAKSKKVKITGAILLSLGLLQLLSTFVVIPLILLIAYLLYKNTARESSALEDISLSEMAADSQDSYRQYQTKDFLDEWEKSVHEEEK